MILYGLAIAPGGDESGRLRICFVFLGKKPNERVSVSADRGWQSAMYIGTHPRLSVMHAATIAGGTAALKARQKCMCVCCCCCCCVYVCLNLETFVAKHNKPSSCFFLSTAPSHIYVHRFAAHRTRRYPAHLQALSVKQQHSSPISYPTGACFSPS